jgi:hypothetical protein
LSWKDIYKFKVIIIFHFISNLCALRRLLLIAVCLGCDDYLDFLVTEPVVYIVVVESSFCLKLQVSYS